MSGTVSSPFRSLAALALGVAAALVAAACAGASTNTGGGAPAAGCTSPSGAAGPGAGATSIGFVYVGSVSDYGYNQAAHAGAVALGKACTNLKVLEADSIPETSDMTTAAEQMIAKGAKVIFSTSYGYKDFAVTLAKKHPEIAVLQQGNFITPPLGPNINTYFGNVYETVYLAGIAAGKATRTRKLGFVAAFPIPQTLLNVNAFELGAQTIDPTIQTSVVFTGNWCDPGKQADAAKSLLADGADVLTQHQDCTGTIIKAAEAKGAYSVGYHYDAAALAKQGWLTGSDWNWGPLYVAMVKSILDGKFSGGPFNTNYSIGFSSKDIATPMDLAPYGPSVAPGTKTLIETTKTKILGGYSPFTGPIADQSGKIMIPEGTVATGQELSSLSYLVKGVVGTLPRRG
jgi:simple sugar transport system substrate-binding protein/basic membrane protein A